MDLNNPVDANKNLDPSKSSKTNFPNTNNTYDVPETVVDDVKKQQPVVSLKKPKRQEDINKKRRKLLLIALISFLAIIGLGIMMWGIHRIFLGSQGSKSKGLKKTPKKTNNGRGGGKTEKKPNKPPKKTTTTSNKVVEIKEPIHPNPFYEEAKITLKPLLAVTENAKKEAEGKSTAYSPAQMANSKYARDTINAAMINYDDADGITKSVECPEPHQLSSVTDLGKEMGFYDAFSLAALRDFFNQPDVLSAKLKIKFEDPPRATKSKKSSSSSSGLSSPGADFDIAAFLKAENKENKAVDSGGLKKMLLSVAWSFFVQPGMGLLLGQGGKPSTVFLNPFLTDSKTNNKFESLTAIIRCWGLHAIFLQDRIDRTEANIALNQANAVRPSPDLDPKCLQWYLDNTSYDRWQDEPTVKARVLEYVLAADYEFAELVSQLMVVARPLAGIDADYSPAQTRALLKACPLTAKFRVGNDDERLGKLTDEATKCIIGQSLEFMHGFAADPTLTPSQLEQYVQNVMWTPEIELRIKYGTWDPDRNSNKTFAAKRTLTTALKKLDTDDFFKTVKKSRAEIEDDDDLWKALNEDQTFRVSFRNAARAYLDLITDLAVKLAVEQRDQLRNNSKAWRALWNSWDWPQVARNAKDLLPNPLTAQNLINGLDVKSTCQGKRFLALPANQDQVDNLENREAIDAKELLTRIILKFAEWDAHFAALKNQRSVDAKMADEELSLELPGFIKPITPLTCGTFVEGFSLYYRSHKTAPASSDGKAHIEFNCVRMQEGVGTKASTCYSKGYLNISHYLADSNTGFELSVLPRDNWTKQELVMMEIMDGACSAVFTST